MKPTLLWRLMSPYRQMIVTVRHQLRQFDAIKIWAAVLHPLSSRKRKDYRDSHRQALWSGEPHHSARTLFQKMGVAVSHARAPAQKRSPSPSSSPPPSVSVIIPNYNHGRFLPERFRSILEQRLPVLEIIVLDDASTDDSRDIISRLVENISIPVKVVFNECNSGSPFSQWARGISLAQGDLIWICESDDSCDPGFLEVLAPQFEDQSVTLAFGRIDLIDQHGRSRVGMARDMEAAAPGYWQIPRLESARTWFHGPFGVRNIIPNVGGCLFRRQEIGADVLHELMSYRVCGDWFFYSNIARGGRIAYAPAARACFRLHEANTSASRLKEASVYEEHIRVAIAIRRHYGTGLTTLRRMYKHVLGHYRSIFGDIASKEFAARHPMQEILAHCPNITHLLIAVNSCDDEGPIAVANEMSRRGYDVSVLIAERAFNGNGRLVVAPEIPIFTREMVEATGLRRFLAEFGIDIINTHHVAVDTWLHSLSGAIFVPYIVSDHGSYGAALPSGKLQRWLLANIDHWIGHPRSTLHLAFLRDPYKVTALASETPLVPGATSNDGMINSYERLYKQVLGDFHDAGLR